MEYKQYNNMAIDEDSDIKFDGPLSTCKIICDQLDSCRFVFTRFYIILSLSFFSFLFFFFLELCLVIITYAIYIINHILILKKFTLVELRRLIK